jgi:hypothetical protein
VHLFLAHLAKGHVSFCHHLASVVCRKLSHLTVSSTTKTGRHDIAEILLKVVLKHQKSNQIKSSIGNTYAAIGKYYT